MKEKKIKEKKEKEKKEKKQHAMKLDPSDPRYAQRRGEFKQKTSEMILKHLKKYFKEQRIATKDDFKHLARKFAHKIMEKEDDKKVFLVKSTTEEKINKVIDAYFERHSVYARDNKTDDL